jgi:DedD protein
MQMTKDQLKRRMVGALVLVSLGVIFIPMLLDTRIADDQFGAVIPKRDTGPFNEQLADRRPEPIERTVPAAAEFDPNTLPPTAAGVPQPGSAEPVSVAAPAVLSSWVVQVGSFSQQDNAAGVAEKLRGAGFDTVVEPVTLEGQTLYRVQVGPVIEEAKAEALRDSIKAQLQLDGKVRRHPPG